MPSVNRTVNEREGCQRPDERIARLDVNEAERAWTDSETRQQEQHGGRQDAPLRDP